MKKTLTTFLVLWLCAFQLKSQTWTTHPTGAVAPLIQISFPNPDTGYVVSDDGEFYKTFDGAATWSPAGAFAQVATVHFLTGQKGFVCADTAVFMTLNAGNTWQRVFYDGAMYPRRFFFADQNTGYMSAYNSIAYDSIKIYKTTNGGLAWSLLTTVPGALTEQSLFFLDAATGFWGNEMEMNMTTNGGTSFANVYTSASDFIINIHFPNQDTGYALGYQDMIRSVNGGTSWTQINSPAGGSNYGLHFFTGNYGFVSGGNGFNSGWVKKTVNAGSSWTSIYTSSSTWWSMDFPTNTVGYFGGDAGEVLKYDATPSGVQENGVAIFVNLFPNPATENCTIDLPVSFSTGTTSVTLYDPQGREAMRVEETDASYIALQKGKLEDGVYLVKIENAAGVITTRVVFE